jgi:hypothetical protein
MSHVRFCPRVEECEPRLLPQGGPWHVLGDWLKQLSADFRQSKAQGRALVVPHNFQVVLAIGGE